MKIPRSFTLYFFSVPIISCVGLGLYSIYDAPTRAHIKSYAQRGWNEWARYNITIENPPQSNRSDGPGKKPPPMPY